VNRRLTILGLVMTGSICLLGACGDDEPEDASTDEATPTSQSGQASDPATTAGFDDWAEQVEVLCAEQEVASDDAGGSLEETYGELAEVDREFSDQLGALALPGDQSDEAEAFVDQWSQAAAAWEPVMEALAAGNNNDFAAAVAERSGLEDEAGVLAEGLGLTACVPEPDVDDGPTGSIILAE
jgi:hypothetical protein